MVYSITSDSRLAEGSPKSLLLILRLNSVVFFIKAFNIGCTPSSVNLHIRYIMHQIYATNLLSLRLR